MFDRNYYVICDDNCKFEGMTKEQILAAIAEATGATVTDVDAAFITKIKEQNKGGALKFWRGTTAEYNALTEFDPDCYYIKTDDTAFDDVNAKFKTIDEQIKGTSEAINAANKSIAEINAAAEIVTATSDSFISNMPETLYAQDDGGFASFTRTNNVNQLQVYLPLIKHDSVAADSVPNINLYAFPTELDGFIMPTEQRFPVTIELIDNVGSNNVYLTGIGQFTTSSDGQSYFNIYKTREVSGVSFTNFNIYLNATYIL